MHEASTVRAWDSDSLTPRESMTPRDTARTGAMWAAFLGILILVVAALFKWGSRGDIPPALDTPQDEHFSATPLSAPRSP